MNDASGPVLYLIVCAAGPAGRVGRLVDTARERGWRVCVIATPAALEFIDTSDLEARTGRPVRSDYRRPDEPRGRGSLPPADAILIAPATYNTINKWAAGVSDTYALGVLSEALGFGVPIVAVPFVNSAMAAHFAFTRSLTDLRAAGVRIIHGPGELEAHTPGTGGNHLDAFPWIHALDEVERLTSGQATSPPT